ncbi:hypothetical protein Hypma_004228 [Hypsizygus marmoreus]|uniref:Uncharacterized protein n=1 Tax=Hypsizygus marmoreus TaxID=39966 RepID=A0A369J7P2_HYPMA|nr:hypothetical protein Hypma_004228 [Hypsizygus marmoreus]
MNSVNWCATFASVPQTDPKPLKANIMVPVWIVGIPVSQLQITKRLNIERLCSIRSPDLWLRYPMAASGEEAHILARNLATL